MCQPEVNKEKEKFKEDYAEWRREGFQIFLLASFENILTDFYSNNRARNQATRKTFGYIDPRFEQQVQKVSLEI